MKSQEEMEILFAEKEVEVNGEKLLIRPFSWSESLRAAQPLGILVGTFVEHVDDIDVALKSIGNQEMNGAQQVLAFAQLLRDVETGPVVEALTRMMELATKKPREFIDSLASDEAIALGMAIYEVNKHFFMKRLAGKLPLGATATA